MGKEVLAVPEDYVAQVIAVIRAGLRVVQVDPDVKAGLSEWCENHEEKSEKEEKGEKH